MTNTPCTRERVLCQIGSGRRRTASPVGALRRQLGGGLSEVEPQRGRSWSVGARPRAALPAGLHRGGDVLPQHLHRWCELAEPDRDRQCCGSSQSADALHPANRMYAGLRSTPSRTSRMVRPSAAPCRWSTAYLIDQSVRNALNLNLDGIDASFTYRTTDVGFGRVHRRLGVHLVHEVPAELRRKPRLLDPEHVGLQHDLPVGRVQEPCTVRLGTGRLRGRPVLELHRVPTGTSVRR